MASARRGVERGAAARDPRPRRGSGERNASRPLQLRRELHRDVDTRPGAARRRARRALDGGVDAELRTRRARSALRRAHVRLQVAQVARADRGHRPPSRRRRLLGAARLRHRRVDRPQQRRTPGAHVNVRRFDVLTRVVHWTIAILTLVLLATGTILYVGQLEAAVGRRAQLATIHVWSGLLLPVPLIVGAVLRRSGARLRADLHELSWWSSADKQWLRRSTRHQPDGKFNGGQKLATALFGGLLLAQLLTGAIMHWNASFSDEWRTGATFVHDWAYLALTVLVLGHIGRALREPELLTAMTVGTVPLEWAHRERPGWARTQPTATSEPHNR